MCWKGLVIAPRYYGKSEACIIFLQARKGGVGRRKEGRKKGNGEEEGCAWGRKEDVKKVGEKYKCEEEDKG